MLDLGDIFELINDRLHNRTFSKQELIGQRHQQIFLIGTDASDQLNIKSVQQFVHHFFRNVASIGQQFTNSFRTSLGTGWRYWKNTALSSTLPGVSVRWSNSPWSLKSRCSLKPKNQPVEDFTLSQSGKDPVGVDSRVLADCQDRRIYEGNSRARLKTGTP